MESLAVSHRSNPALSLKNSPLALVLTQLRFPTYLHMEKHVGDIQESLRKLGLVRFSKEQTQQLMFGPEFKQSTSARWVFGNRARTEAVVLADNFVVFEVSKYESFDAYLERMLALFEPVRTQATLDCVEQVGIRYLDVLRDSEKLKIEEMICDSLRGLEASTLGLEQSNYQFIVQGVTPHGTLSVRSFENSGKQFLPPDLQTEHLVFAASLKQDARFRVVDFDHIHRGDIDFDDSALGEKLWDLHDHTDTAFRQIVTPDALELWKGEQR